MRTLFREREQGLGKCAPGQELGREEPGRGKDPESLLSPPQESPFPLSESKTTSTPQSQPQARLHPPPSVPTQDPLLPGSPASRSAHTEPPSNQGQLTARHPGSAEMPSGKGRVSDGCLPSDAPVARVAPCFLSTCPAVLYAGSGRWSRARPDERGSRFIATGVPTFMKYGTGQK